MSRSRSRRLPASFYTRPALTVARDLLGRTLCRELANGSVLRGTLVEVEAYDGPDDRASHAFRGRTARNRWMFEAGGLAYVYLVYGMHHCLNVVTEREEFPAAVLIRAVEIDGELIDGPGRLCRAMQIDRSLNRVDLTIGESIWFEDRGVSVEKGDVGTYPRIGVQYAGEWAKKPWRFRLRMGAVPTRTRHIKKQGGAR